MTYFVLKDTNLINVPIKVHKLMEQIGLPIGWKVKRWNSSVLRLPKNTEFDFFFDETKVAESTIFGTRCQSL